ncbi:MAG: hypothetical protein ACTSO7_18905 [Candidatus Heimdallarchaeota archaeon]
MADEVVNSRITKDDLVLLDKGLKDFTEKELTTPNLEQLKIPPMLSEKQLEKVGKDLFDSSIVKLVAEGRER